MGGLAGADGVRSERAISPTPNQREGSLQEKAQRRFAGKVELVRNQMTKLARENGLRKTGVQGWVYSYWTACARRPKSGQCPIAVDQPDRPEKQTVSGAQTSVMNQGQCVSGQIQG